MLQNITENSKNGNPSSNKVSQNNTKVPQKASAKKNSDPHKKGGLPVNNVTNVDKLALETASKNL